MGMLFGPSSGFEAEPVLGFALKPRQLDKMGDAMGNGYVSTGAAWFTLSLVNAGLAQGKGRAGLSWWLLSLLLGPMATLLIVMLPAVEAANIEPVD